MRAISTPDPTTGPFSDQQLAAWRGMLQVHAEVTQLLDAQMRAEHGMSVSSYEVPMFLAEAPDRRMRVPRFAARVLPSPTGRTRLVDRLVELGYVTRCAAEDDGRGAFAELTDAGLDKFEAAQRSHREGVRDVFLDRLTPTDQVVLGDIWTRFLSGGA